MADTREIYADLTRRISPLQQGYTATPRTSWAQRTLAELRRADPAAPGADPALWEVTLNNMPEGLAGRGDAPSWAESAIHASLVLYAVHQQGASLPMHVSGVGLGDAVRRVSYARSGSDWDPGTISRFHALARAQSSAIRLHHLRGLVTLMRGEKVPLDYGQLASDLWLLNTRGADRVMLRWGRQLHRLTNTPTPDHSTEGDNA
ncbi:MAG: type I-E CRISPR-associated protein Cse2/CasB [Arachnia sp.]